MNPVSISRVPGEVAFAELPLGQLAGPAVTVPARAGIPQEGGAGGRPGRLATRLTPWRVVAGRRLLPVATPWLVPVLLLVLWSLSAAHEWIPTQILPAPATVVATLNDFLQSGELFDHTTISLQRVLYGFAAGTTLGLLLGVAMGLSPLVKDYVYPTFKAFAQVPALGWLPLLMMLVGIDETLKILLIAKASMVPVALNTFQGFRDVPARYVEVAQVFGFSRRQLLRRVVFPAAFPPIWNGIRYGLTHAWLALVVVELLASSEGLGFLIVYGRQLYQLDVVLAAVVVVGFIGFALDRLLALVETRLLRWRRDVF